MLKNLLVKNLALVNQINLNFEQGFNVISGETGAGKSVVINALSFLLGSRFSKNFLGSFSNQTILSATFDISDNLNLMTKLKNLGYLDEQNSDNEITIRRIISLESSHSYINGQKISTKEIEDLSNQLIDIHSQHSQQSLMNNSFQRKLLDDYLKIDLTRLTNSVNEIKKIEEKILKAKEKNLNLERKELLEFYLTELNDANLNYDELNEIETDYKQISQIEIIKQDLAKAENIINDSQSGMSVQFNQLNKTVQNLIKNNSDFSENNEALEQISIALETLSENIFEYFQKIEDNKSVEEIELRLNELDKLARKHHCTIEQLLDKKSQLDDELHQFDNQFMLLSELENQKNKLLNEYYQEAEKVSKLRNKTAIILAEKIEKRLMNLAMKTSKISFEILSDKKVVSLNGFDKVEIKVSLNKLNPTAADFLPLKQIASGGELSRIALAVETELASSSNLNSLVFDEVDTGIGGDVANQVGLNLKELAKNNQVICITHLPQIAVFASNHLVVEKTLEKNQNSEQNTIKIKSLNSEKQRVEEISRMLSGDINSKASLDHAQNMLNKAKEI